MCIFVGIHVVYDLSRAPGSRVVSLEVLCTACRVPAYVPLQMDEIYNVTLPSYMLFGGDGYSMLKDKNLGYSKGKGDTVQVNMGSNRVAGKQLTKMKRPFYSINLWLFAYTQWLNLLLPWQLWLARFGCRQQLYSFSVKTTKVSKRNIINSAVLGEQSWGCGKPEKQQRTRRVHLTLPCTCTHYWTMHHKERCHFLQTLNFHCIEVSRKTESSPPLLNNMQLRWTTQDEGKDDDLLEGNFGPAKTREPRELCRQQKAGCHRHHITEVEERCFKTLA